MKIMKYMAILLVLLLIPMPTQSANVSVTETVTVIPTSTLIATTATPQATETAAKFRVGPTVKIRPVNDEINKSTDGLIELYMDNPSLNDVTLNVDARISVPSGIHVYGQGFGEAGAAGTVYGTFDIPPGKARTIYITIKAEKVGEFYAQFSGMYWPDDNKDDFQPISLTHPFKVTEESASPNQPIGVPPEQRQTHAISIGISILTVMLVFAIIRYNKKINK